MRPSASAASYDPKEPAPPRRRSKAMAFCGSRLAKKERTSLGKLRKVRLWAAVMAPQPRNTRFS